MNDSYQTPFLVIAQKVKASLLDQDAFFNPKD
jgi:hypothetical protein